MFLLYSFETDDLRREISQNAARLAARRADDALARKDLDLAYASIDAAYSAMDAFFGRHQAA